MDVMLLTGIAVALLIILLTVYFIQSKRNKSDSERLVELNRLGGQRNQGAVARRVQIARNQRNRIRLNVANQHENGGERQVSVAEEENSEVSKGQVLDEKMGTKKRAKLEAKEAKRQMREAELKQREDRKAKEAKLEEERKKQEAKEIEEEYRQLEVERLAREQKERKELEDYLKMKVTFNVEEEGFDDADDDEKENLLVEFINYIKINKVVILEDLATEFKLKTQQVIDRIQELQKNGTITGVIDDRGKFIYISEEELHAVAKFMRQRGRVSISELAECSNNLIHITPITSNVN